MGTSACARMAPSLSPPRPPPAIRRNRVCPSRIRRCLSTSTPARGSFDFVRLIAPACQRSDPIPGHAQSRRRHHLPGKWLPGNPLLISHAADRQQRARAKRTSNISRLGRGTRSVVSPPDKGTFSLGVASVSTRNPTNRINPRSTRNRQVGTFFIQGDWGSIRKPWRSLHRLRSSIRLPHNRPC